MSLTAREPIVQLENAILDLLRHPAPFVPNPPECTKRASTVLIIRVRPSFEQQATSTFVQQKHGFCPSELSERLENVRRFFENDWVKNGDPEILFIKRAARAGDRWSGHVALPGGGKESQDASDLAAGVRETLEEVGIDLTETACYAGNLAERVVTSTWGNHVLMVLCPFVCLLMTPGPVELRPQPSEVASIQWVPLRALLSPERRTKELINISDRIAKDRNWFSRAVLRSTLGKMTFSAVRLLPSESLHCSSIDGFLPPDRSQIPIKEAIRLVLTGHEALSLQPTEQPLQLWGLTLGMVADFLDIFPPGNNSVKLWAYPTFTNPDLRFILWLVTFSLRRVNAKDALANGGREKLSAVDDSTATLAVHDLSEKRESQNSVGISGLGLGRPNHTRLVSTMLDGYFARMHWAIALWLALRTIFGTAMIALLFKRLKRRPR
ncbi:MAG: hypothetical protein Q9227_005788 [Pyrenula ochraceoflavens]